MIVSTIIALLIILAVWYAVKRFVPLSPSAAKAVDVIAVILAVIVLLNAVGIWTSFTALIS